jgi:hypothetical protein
MKFSVLTVLAISAMASALPEPQASSSAIADAGAAQCPSACPGGTNIRKSEVIGVELLFPQIWELFLDK